MIQLQCLVLELKEIDYNLHQRVGLCLRKVNGYSSLNEERVCTLKARPLCEFCYSECGEYRSRTDDLLTASQTL